MRTLVPQQVTFLYSVPEVRGLMNKSCWGRREEVEWMERELAVFSQVPAAGMVAGGEFWTCEAGTNENILIVCLKICLLPLVLDPFTPDRREL